MQLYVKNMVCDRCVLVVRLILRQLGLNARTLRLGLIDLPDTPLLEQQLPALHRALAKVGFEVLEEKKQKLVNQIKSLVINLVHHSDSKSDIRHLKLSSYITASLHYDYTYLSRLFSETEGCTIEQYFIRQKIERAKELLAYREMNISELADDLGYSSVAHFSAQFKKITGTTPSAYKALDQGSRKTLDALGKKI
jgi:AraC family transcriptional regulator